MLREIKVTRYNLVTIFAIFAIWSKYLVHRTHSPKYNEC